MFHRLLPRTRVATTLTSLMLVGMLLVSDAFAQQKYVLQSANKPMMSLETAAMAARKTANVGDQPLFREVPNKTRGDSRSVLDTGVRSEGDVQDMQGLSSTSILNSYDGSDNNDNATVLGFRIAPPDTDGDVGSTQYMQMLNLVTTVFDKATGAELGPGPFPGNAFWDGMGGNCDAFNNGDPIILYDEQNDRWFVSQFAFDSNFTTFSQCIAVSQTDDALGAYNRYEFSFDNIGFNDYPKFGFSTDGISMMANLFSPPGFSFGGTFVGSIDRACVTAGNANCDLIGFNLGGSEFGFVTGDLDDETGTSGFVPDLFPTSNGGSGSRIDIWRLDPDFANNGAGATVNEIATIPVSAFDGDLCTASRDACVPQPSPGSTLESLADRLMYRGQIRDFGSYQTMLLAKTIDVGNTGRAGIRWWEMRNSGGGADDWALYQEGTYAPADGENRWMPSIAMNPNGDIGMGYLLSSTNTFMSTAVTGQSAANSGTGIMDSQEAFCVQGTGAQTGTARAGDYSATHIDPDTGSFWHTNEYGRVTGSFEWATRICEFTVEGGGGGGSCEGTNVTLVDNLGFEWCWDGTVVESGVTGPDDLVCSGQGVTMAGTVLNAYPETSSTAAVCRNERAFEGEAVNGTPDGCDQFSDSFLYDGTREGNLAYAGTWASFCNGEAVATGDWNGTFDQNVRAPQVQRRAASPMLGKRALRRAERGSARADRMRKGDVEGPIEFGLEQNYPNPFNPTTQVRFALAEASNVSLRVYNLLGQEVAVLANGRMEAGRHEVQFDASQLTAGVYLYVLEAGDFTATKRLTLLK